MATKPFGPSCLNQMRLLARLLLDFGQSCDDANLDLTAAGVDEEGDNGDVLLLESFQDSGFIIEVDGDVLDIVVGSGLLGLVFASDEAEERRSSGQSGLVLVEVC